MSKLPYRQDPKPFAAGAFATVTRGEHRVTGRVVAIKKPKGDAEARARFQREIEVHETLTHPCVMPVIDCSESLRTPWFAMPMAARTLTKAIEQDGDVNEITMVGVIKRVVSALSYAHAAGYVHRDVNPNNVMELREGPGSRWVLGDWGLVRLPGVLREPRLTRRAIGTEGFIAPEAEVDPAAADERSDVYSVGRVAHFAVTGVWPRTSFPMPAPGALWTEFVRECTRPAAQRPATMADVRPLLTNIDATLARMEHHQDELICPRCDLPMAGARCGRCGTVWD
jgi:serine/threonine protein kinase